MVDFIGITLWLFSKNDDLPNKQMEFDQHRGYLQQIAMFPTLYGDFTNILWFTQHACCFMLHNWFNIPKKHDDSSSTSFVDWPSPFRHGEKSPTTQWIHRNRNDIIEIWLKWVCWFSQCWICWLMLATIIEICWNHWSQCWGFSSEIRNIWVLQGSLGYIPETSIFVGENHHV